MAAPAGMEEEAVVCLVCDVCFCQRLSLRPPYFFSFLMSLDLSRCQDKGGENFRNLLRYVPVADACRVLLRDSMIPTILP